MGRGIEQFHGFSRGVFREIMKLQVGLEEGGVAARARALEQLERLLARGQERGELSGDLPASALAVAFDSLANGTINHWHYDDTSGSLRGCMGAAAKVFLGAVGAAASPEEPLPDLTAAPWDPSPPVTRSARALGWRWLRYDLQAWRRGRAASWLVALPWEELLPLRLERVRRLAGVAEADEVHPGGVWRGSIEHRCSRRPERHEPRPASRRPERRRAARRRSPASVTLREPILTDEERRGAMVDRKKRSRPRKKTAAKPAARPARRAKPAATPRPARPARRAKPAATPRPARPAASARPGAEGIVYSDVRREAVVRRLLR